MLMGFQKLRVGLLPLESPKKADHALQGRRSACQSTRFPTLVVSAGGRLAMLKRHQLQKHTHIQTISRGRILFFPHVLPPPATPAFFTSMMWEPSCCDRAATVPCWFGQSKGRRCSISAPSTCRWKRKDLEQTLRTDLGHCSSPKPGV